MFHKYSFEKLHVYQEALDFCAKIREVIKRLPKEEKYGLSNQLKRSADSIGANLAEGSGRSSNYDQAHFTNIAFGSALETIHHLNLAFRYGLIQNEEYSMLRQEMDKIINKLNALYKYQIKNTKTLKKRTIKR